MLRELFVRGGPVWNEPVPPAWGGGPPLALAASARRRGEVKEAAAVPGRGPGASSGAAIAPGRRPGGRPGQGRV